MLTNILILVMAYLVGSIPFGLVIAYIAGYGDIRKIGSGNIGTTNVLRTGNKVMALLTLVADSGKIIVAILIAHQLNFFQDYYVAAAGFLGHLFPVWLKFKGGKGVASFFGLSLYLFPKIALVLLVTWLITFFVTKYSSLAAIIAAFAGIIALFVLEPLNANLFLVLGLIFLILIKHQDNIIRLVNKTESRFK